MLEPSYMPCFTQQMRTKGWLPVKYRGSGKDEAVKGLLGMASGPLPFAAGDLALRDGHDQFRGITIGPKSVTAVMLSITSPNSPGWSDTLTSAVMPGATLELPYPGYTAFLKAKEAVFGG